MEVLHAEMKEMIFSFLNDGVSWIICTMVCMEWRNLAFEMKRRNPIGHEMYQFFSLMGTYGFIEIMPWTPMLSSYLPMVALNGYTNLLKRCPVDKYTWKYAAAGGHLETIEWCIPINKEHKEHKVARIAMQCRHIHILDWCLNRIKDHKLNLKEYRGDNVDILEWIVLHLDDIKISSPGINYYLDKLSSIYAYRFKRCELKNTNNISRAGGSS